MTIIEVFKAELVRGLGRADFFYLHHGMGTAKMLFVRLAVGNKWTKIGIVLMGHLLGSRRA